MAGAVGGAAPQEEAVRGLSVWGALGFSKVLTTAEAVLAEPWPVSSPCCSILPPRPPLPLEEAAADGRFWMFELAFGR